MAQVDIEDVVEYQTFRKNPGPLLTRAATGRPLLVVKGRERLIVLDAEAYQELVQRAAQAAGQEGTAPRQSAAG
jgi:prevent-host-death family protein